MSSTTSESNLKRMRKHIENEFGLSSSPPPTNIRKDHSHNRESKSSRHHRHSESRHHRHRNSESRKYKSSSKHSTHRHRSSRDIESNTTYDDLLLMTNKTGSVERKQKSKIKEEPDKDDLSISKKIKTKASLPFSASKRDHLRDSLLEHAREALDRSKAKEESKEMTLNNDSQLQENLDRETELRNKIIKSMQLVNETKSKIENLEKQNKNANINEKEKCKLSALQPITNITEVTNLKSDRHQDSCTNSSTLGNFLEDGELKEGEQSKNDQKTSKKELNTLNKQSEFLLSPSPPPQHPVLHTLESSKHDFKNESLSNELQQEKQEEEQSNKNNSNNISSDTVSESPSKLQQQEPQNQEQEKNEEDQLKAIEAELLFDPSQSRCRDVTQCYRRLNTIHSGSYGVVHRAENRITGEIVALKKINMNHQSVSGFPITSIREISLLMGLNHPNIVSVKEVVLDHENKGVYMVMEYMDHDIKALMSQMNKPFSTSEVKCLMQQLLIAVKEMHDNWILHRDLKTSNLLLDNNGTLKVCDFGMARKYGSPLPAYSHNVVTLWYRAPELLFCRSNPIYSVAVDIQSCGCIFGEFLLNSPLCGGKKEVEQLDLIFKLLGTPNNSNQPGFDELCQEKHAKFPIYKSKLREVFPIQSYTGKPTLSEKGMDLLKRMLCYDPLKRITAEEALSHEQFRENPKPQQKSMMPTFPSLNEESRNKALYHAQRLKKELRKNIAKMANGGFVVH